jgi:hypothetical protein
MSAFRRAAAFVAAAALSFFAPPPAFGANGVFGGSTSAAEAIVITTDAKAKKLRSAVIVWEAACQDGRSFPLASALTPVKPELGFSPGPDDLVISQNAKGRFAGTQLTARELGSQTALIVVDLTGRLRGRRASGKLAATVSIRDDASGAEVMTCETGSLRWSASRSAGRIFGGKTTQDEPVVARLDRKRKTVTDLLVGWESDTCQPPERYFRFGERYRGLRVRSGRFGSTDDESFPTDDGGTVAFAYELAGSVARRSVKGRLHVTVTGTDAAGATTLSCDSGNVTWKAATG